jgi:hypothetical protein
MIKALSDGYKMSPMQALGNILFVIFIFAVGFVACYVYDPPRPAAGIHSEAHMAEVAKHVVKK